jgi:hypothetical protein
VKRFLSHFLGGERLLFWQGKSPFLPQKVFCLGGLASEFFNNNPAAKLRGGVVYLAMIR